jgi:D-alanyl-D-alanine carboxypeptidase/D-alanyl-D-alanine-endopeptidase (penicillin-binding protein 4)
MAQIQIVNREVPVFTYQDGGNVDQWTVARGALGNGGSRWLPVRYPALYAGEVFATFVRSHGIVLKAPVEVSDLPSGAVLATFESPPLTDILRDMLKYSTNITAEAAGMTATERRTGQKRGLRTSALGMSQWAKTRAEISPQFADHSGLSDASRISAADMVGLLTAEGAMAQLFPIMKDIAFKNEDGQTLKDHPATVLAKTGTLNFVSGLAGYLRTASGRDLAFAIFAADLDAREKGKLSQDEQPFGSISFNTAAKRLQQVLLQRWAVLAEISD